MVFLLFECRVMGNEFHVKKRRMKSVLTLSQICLLPLQLHILKQHGSIIIHSKVIKTFLECDGNAIHTAENEMDKYYRVGTIKVTTK